MVVKIVDASALAALLFGEPEADAIATQLQDAELVGPALLPFEIANICLTKMRRHPRARDDLLAAFTLLDRMAIRTIEVDHLEVLALAERSGLTAYDASYLWLARRLGADLTTLDRQLAAAATGAA
jgi:predicted nucleic acid-binding protein